MKYNIARNIFQHMKVENSQKMAAIHSLLQEYQPERCILFMETKGMQNGTLVLDCRTGYLQYLYSG